MMRTHGTIETKVIISLDTLKAIALIIEGMNEKNDPRGIQREAFISLKEKVGVVCLCSLGYAYRERDLPFPDEFSVKILPPGIKIDDERLYKAFKIPQEAFFLIKNEVEEKFSAPIEMWFNSLKKQM